VTHKQTTYEATENAELQHTVAFLKDYPMTQARKAHNQLMIHLEPAEVLAVLRAAKKRGAREWAMIVLAYKHGLRASEVCNLQLDDVDLKNGNIIVERLKGSLRTTQALTEHRGEPLLNELKALREWLRERPNDGSDFLFVSQKGGRLDRSQFFRLFQSITAAAGLPPEKRHPHALKHSLASHLVSANMNLALVKQQLGHKSIGSTMRYVAASDPQASAATTSALMKIY
jgi:type 1 fimbriae regulatory protein FimB